MKGQLSIPPYPTVSSKSLPSSAAPPPFFPSLGHFLSRDPDLIPLEGGDGGWEKRSKTYSDVANSPRVGVFVEPAPMPGLRWT